MARDLRERLIALGSAALGRGEGPSVSPPRTGMEPADRQQLYAVIGFSVLVVVLGAITFFLTT
ncbi:MAG TPA: hypothetical protein VIL01_12240 [Thermomicrobiales bacterium]